jgi:hypothetical protein
MSRRAALLCVVTVVVLSACSSGGSGPTDPLETPTTSAPKSPTTTVKSPDVTHDEGDGHSDHSHDGDKSDDAKALDALPAAPPDDLADFTTGRTRVLYYAARPADLEKKLRAALTAAGWTIAADARAEGTWGFTARRGPAEITGGVLDCSATRKAPDGSAVAMCPSGVAPQGSRSQLTMSLND